MLTITNTQFQAMEELLYAEKQQLVLRELHRQFAAAIVGVPTPVLQERVHGALARCRKYGLNSEYNLVLFAALTFIVDPVFDEHPEISKHLLDVSLPPNERLNAAIYLSPTWAWSSFGEKTGLIQISGLPATDSVDSN